MCMNSAMKTIDNPSELSESNPIIKKKQQTDETGQGEAKQRKNKQKNSNITHIYKKKKILSLW